MQADVNTNTKQRPLMCVAYAGLDCQFSYASIRPIESERVMNTPEITCAKCQRTFSERDLSTQYTVKEFCPSCGNLIRDESKVTLTDTVAMTAGDIAAIENWLEIYSASRPTPYCKCHTNSVSVHRWAIDVDASYPCEVEYDVDRPGVLSLNLVTDQNAEAMVRNETELRRICASNGVEFSGRTYTDNIANQTITAWGACQHLSTYSIHQDHFSAILKRLDDTMDTMMQHLKGQSGN